MLSCTCSAAPHLVDIQHRLLLVLPRHKSIDAQAHSQDASIQPEVPAVMMLWAVNISSTQCGSTTKPAGIPLIMLLQIFARFAVTIQASQQRVTSLSFTAIVQRSMLAIECPVNILPMPLSVSR